MEYIAALMLFVSAAVPADKAAMVDFMRLAECHGKFPSMVMSYDMNQREKLAAFLELRRRGAVPVFDRDWCIERGVLPFRKTKERPT